MPKNKLKNNIRKPIVKINHLLRNPPINNIAIVIIIYMITAPVSGSMNVSADGMNKTINTFMINFNSSIISGFLYVSLKSVIILDRVIIKNIFINSLGWSVPKNGILNQHFALFTFTPKNNTRINDDTPIR